MNKKFAILLSGLCDVYEVFGNGVNILQKVDMLPHDKYDQFQIEVIERYEAMATPKSHTTCLEQKQCYWPVHHHDLEDIASKSMYRGIAIAQSNADDTDTRQGRERAVRNPTDENVDTMIFKAIQSLIEFVKRLQDDLAKNVYSEKTRKL